MTQLRKSAIAAVLMIATLSSAEAATINLATATIADLQAAYKTGKLSAEQVTKAYLARIAAYDKQGPVINSVITLNPKALEVAKALDAERKAGKVRGPLHGVPIVLKDNFDTFDLPTTAGSQLLKGSIPPDDAYVVKKLREAGAIIVAKVNLSEWAGSGGSVSGATDLEVLKLGAVPNGSSSMGGQTRNPHDLTRGPSGSSGGTGAAIAAVFAQFGLGTDTGGSVRGPSTANGIVGLKPTHGLMSRDGIVPLALSFDTGGPMARSVYDIATALTVMTGVDSADSATAKSAGHIEADYTRFLKAGSLKGARIGFAKDFTGKDDGVDAVMTAAVAKLKALGATVVDVKYPDYLIAAKQPIYNQLVSTEFKAQVTQYLKTTKPGFPKTFDEVVAKSNDPKTNYQSPGKAYALKYTASIAQTLDDPAYLAVKNEQLAAVRSGIDAIFVKYKVDAIVYPTSPKPATLIVPDKPPQPSAGTDSATSFANETGYPDLIVPAGMTPGGLPVAISFFGPAWSEPKLLGYGYDFEQATHALVEPKHTPAMPGDVLNY
ncbi:amidase family protein [Nevskia ramosa]|uniref:amidase family protein n=1 Tax=Nevskia ramosa TaxID=64002 RepID=UPI0003B6C6FE|nr:amidase family protein [Nevskia ramosa]